MSLSEVLHPDTNKELEHMMILRSRPTMDQWISFLLARIRGRRKTARTTDEQIAMVIEDGPKFRKENLHVEKKTLQETRDALQVLLLGFNNNSFNGDSEHAEQLYLKDHFSDWFGWGAARDYSLDGGSEADNENGFSSLVRGPDDDAMEEILVVWEDDPFLRGFIASEFQLGEKSTGIAAGFARQGHCSYLQQFLQWFGRSEKSTENSIPAQLEKLLPIRDRAESATDAMREEQYSS